MFCHVLTSTFHSFNNAWIKRFIGLTVKASELQYLLFCSKRWLSISFIQPIVFVINMVIEEPKTADKIANKNANLLSLFRVNSLSKYK